MITPYHCPITFSQFKQNAEKGKQFYRYVVGCMNERDAVEGYLAGLPEDQRVPWIDQEIAWAEAEYEKGPRPTTKKGRMEKAILYDYMKRLQDKRRS